MLCISCPNRNAAPGFFSRCGVWLRLLADGGQLLRWWGVRWCWWLDWWGRFAASRERLTLWRNCGCFRNRRLRQNWVSRFGWIDGFDGWTLGELRLLFYKGLLGLILRRGRQIVRRCDRWPLTNRLLLAAHSRGRRAAWRPSARLLHMANSGCFCWCGFGLYLIADFRCFRLFTNRRNFFLRSTIRKPDFRLLRMQMIQRRRFFCAGFLCTLDIGTAALLLWLKFWLVLPLRQFWPYAYILHALARLFFNRRGVGNCRAFRRFCCGGRLCGLLDIGTSGLLLRRWRRCAL